MHWFWRGAIAVSIGGVSCYGLLVGAEEFLSKYFGSPIPFPAAILFGIIIPQSLCILIYSYLTRWLGPNLFDGETRCRKCGYILRGISEPRCPECGERI